MKKKQLSPQELQARAERVYAISSVVPLAQAPEQTLRYYTHLTDVRLRSALEPDWGIYIAESSKWYGVLYMQDTVPSHSL